ncbi:hypothetical protein GCK72_023111 [Caenorhabditis remanei]|uniref:Uncharacterized protein n=1 Tax=Caenorhabditis remanei TaxID=31234 RepID=E3MKJ3_CAERE|nr:hypothetical protein GCK72_023111 [Caenorhabditis remanei]EFP04020.1 hypothetical protein CRE_27689 [Caenorhabditis remanei]KAF1746654.1 hypothetical protein GCK72_023111 [Caenorhabditis remanei]
MNVNNMDLPVEEREAVVNGGAEAQGNPQLEEEYSRVDREHKSLKIATKQEMEDFDNGGYMPPNRKIKEHPFVVKTAKTMMEYKMKGMELEMIAFNSIRAMMAKIREISKKERELAAVKEKMEQQLAAVNVDIEKCQEVMDQTWGKD